MDPFISFLLKIRNRHLLVLDILVFLVTPLAALALRLDGLSQIPDFLPSLLICTVIFLLTKVTAFLCGQLYTRFWRYAGLDDLANLGLLAGIALAIQTTIFMAVARPLGWVDPHFPQSIPLIEGVLAFIAVGAIRFGVPLAERIYYRRRLGANNGEPVVIAGARSAGVMIARDMQANPKVGMHPVAFVDDDFEKIGGRIRGIPVLGECARVADVCRQTGARKVIIAMPMARGRLVRQIMNICEQADIQTKILPAVNDLADGSLSLRQLRDVDIEDLLRREPVKTDTVSLVELIRGKRVLVTGGGGSIGSELCRQIVHFGPASLMIVGHGENSVFEIHQELSRSLAQVKANQAGDGTPPDGFELHYAIADIRSEQRIRGLLREYRPDIVFHCAAHKHVPLMESNPGEAITNNVLGTHTLLEAALEADIERFVMISTDKAVNPTSVMGASKRVAELLVHGAVLRSGKPYCAVRFGNVLGSRGSVVHTFKQQIASGGPVTVTHPEMKRYFMTIPEAVQLVLQAAALSRGGEVFMLDMGEPVKIVDLAKDLIRLAAPQLGGDVEIVYTGLRPGEKLFEELLLSDEQYRRTQHEKVFIAANGNTHMPYRFDEVVAKLEQAGLRDDTEAIHIYLRNLVPEYSPDGALPRVPARIFPESHGQRSSALEGAAK